MLNRACADSAARGAPVEGRRDPEPEPVVRSRETGPVRVATEPPIEDVALVAEGEAPRVESQGELAQAACRAGVADGDVGVHGRLEPARQPRRIHPQGARVGEVARMEVGGCPVGCYLGGERSREEQEQDGRSVPHYGCTATADRVTWMTGIPSP